MAAYLGLWSAEDPSRYAFDFLTEDAGVEFCNADDAYRRIEGREAVGHMARIPRDSEQLDVQRPEVFQTLYPDIFFVEYKAKAYVPATQRTYRV